VHDQDRRGAGAQHYLEKPYTITEVIALVESFLAAARERDAPH
jgi:DNA-binding response OmpR family regulator